MSFFKRYVLKFEGRSVIHSQMLRERERERRGERGKEVGRTEGGRKGRMYSDG